MDIDSEEAVSLTEILEDVMQYFCDEYRVSGERGWAMVQMLSIIKLAELRNEPVSF